MTNRQVTPAALMAKAGTACSSAHALLELGDTDGAANRAYYAVFDAARAALLVSGAPVKADIGRTHSGLIAAFGNFLVKNGSVSKEMGRLVNRAHQARLMADYTEDSVEMADVKEMLQLRRTFLATMRTEFMPGNTNGDGGQNAQSS